MRDAVAAADSDAPVTTDPDVLVAPDSTWAYQDDGSYVGTSWRGRSYDDSAWRRGASPFGYGDGDEETALTPNRLSYVFRKGFDVSNPASYGSLKLVAARDDGLVVWLNGVEVWRDNMPDGSSDNTTSAATCAAGLGETDEREATVPPSLLVSGRNVLAVSLHNCSEASSDARLAIELSRG
jgi:hypothetical protein